MGYWTWGLWRRSWWFLDRSCYRWPPWLHVWKQRKHRIQKLWRIQQRLGMGWWRIQQRIYRGFLYYWWGRRVFLVIWYQDSFWIWWNEEEINTKLYISIVLSMQLAM